jgi:hypothetical protein
MVGFYGGAPAEYESINEQGTEAVPASTGQVLGATFGQGLAGNLGPRLMQSAGRTASETGLIGVDDFGNPIMTTPDTMVDPATLNQKYGIPGVLSFDKPTTEDVAKSLHDAKHEEILRQDTIGRRESGLLTGGAARFGAAAAAGLLDPINLAAGFIPFVGEERAASLLGRAAIETMGAGERFGVRALTGAGQGAASIAALQPLEFGLSSQEHEDYTMADALQNIAIGGLLGGGLHAIGSAVADRATGRFSNPLTQRLEDAGPDTRADALQSALAQTIDGRPVDVAPVLDAADAARAADAGHMTLDEMHTRIRGFLDEIRKPYPDEAPATADANAVMARPSDELAAINQQIADLERQAEPPELTALQQRVENLRQNLSTQERQGPNDVRFQQLDQLTDELRQAREAQGGPAAAPGAPVDVGEARARAAERAASCISRGFV